MICACVFTEDKEETLAKVYISELKNIRLRLEDCEQRLLKQIQSPASSKIDRDARQDIALRIAEQEVSCRRENNSFQIELGSKHVWLLRSEAKGLRQPCSGIYPSLQPVEEWDSSFKYIIELIHFQLQIGLLSNIFHLFLHLCCAFCF